MKSISTSSLQLTSVQSASRLFWANKHTFSHIIDTTHRYFWRLDAGRCTLWMLRCKLSSWFVCYVLCYGFEPLVCFSCRLSASSFEFLVLPCFILKVVSLNFLSDFTLSDSSSLTFPCLHIWVSMVPVMSASMSACMWSSAFNGLIFLGGGFFAFAVLDLFACLPC